MEVSAATPETVGGEYSLSTDGRQFRGLRPRIRSRPVTMIDQRMWVCKNFSSRDVKIESVTLT